MRKLLNRLLRVRPESDRETTDNARLRKLERDTLVLTGELPPGTDELPLLSEYRLATWLSGPGR